MTLIVISAVDLLMRNVCLRLIQANYEMFLSNRYTKPLKVQGLTIDRILIKNMAVVEMRRVELPTSALRTQRSAN